MQSLYNTFYAQHRIYPGFENSERFRCDPECLLEPFVTINQKRPEVPITQFLENLENHNGSETRHFYRTQNFQGKIHHNSILLNKIEYFFSL